jgi:hypothetical protein
MLADETLTHPDTHADSFSPVVALHGRLLRGPFTEQIETLRLKGLLDKAAGCGG